MKLGFTADIHIKLGQKNVPVDWAKNRYNLLFDKMEDLESKIDKWVVGGDVFDKVPTMEELELYFNMIARFNKPTIIYPGNHEALKKNTTFLSYLKDISAKVNRKVLIIDDYYTDEDGIDYLPYNKLKEYNPQDVDFHGDILCTHVRGEIPPHVKPEVPLEIFSRWKYVLAGDLHSYDNCQLNILYPGSPVTTSFHRSRVDTGIIVFDTTDFSHTWERLNLPQMLRKTVKVGEHMIAGKDDLIIYEVEGDISELSKVEDSTLIDKKIVKRSTDTALILDPEMKLEEEVKEYLQYVLELNEDAVAAVLFEMAGYAHEITD
ncbi:Calcineurin-like phosphoesterase domain, ApaH type [uncultured Caudovirales phage]|uniref:Calcineurin-like phosphoesterase domain, ApaH type n=1 Tax=uncultured Caudovirales phage TaxID=2100421 RepID=A0A6J5LL99_9CAUD|nr:Calcineurin-like phosphoesterase domain, ApaH type [uncultured Caudovirales phage]